MFLVGDNYDSRKEVIKFYLEQEPAVGLLLSAINFEWIVRRAILALGKTPTKILRSQILKNHCSLDKYKDLWNSEVSLYLIKRLPEVVTDWNGLKKCFNLRHKMVHGVRVSVDTDYAKRCVEIALKSSDQVYIFAKNNNYDLFRRIVRIKEKICYAGPTVR